MIDYQLVYELKNQPLNWSVHGFVGVQLMHGSEYPGLVPRIAGETFEVLATYKHECTAVVRVFMFELYKDDLLDLFLPKAQAKKPLWSNMVLFGRMGCKIAKNRKNECSSNEFCG